MIRVVVGLILLAHGVGHSMGLLQSYHIATVNPRWQGDSWLLSGATGPAATRAIGTALWTLAMVGFVLATGVVFGWVPQAWWVPLVVGASVASLAGLLLFPTAFPPFSTVGALAVDLVVLVAVLWYDWAPSDLPT